MTHDQLADHFGPCAQQVPLAESLAADPEFLGLVTQFMLDIDDSPVLFRVHERTQAMELSELAAIVAGDPSHQVEAFDDLFQAINYDESCGGAEMFKPETTGDYVRYLATIIVFDHVLELLDQAIVARGVELDAEMARREAAARQS
jgi:hypothetical protein